MHFAVHFQPGVERQEWSQGIWDEPQVPGKSLPLAPQSPSRYLRLLGPALAQVKDLPGIEIPEERLDDFSAL